MYQAAGSLSELRGSSEEYPDVSRYLDSLEVRMQDVWKMACAAGFLETDAMAYWDDEETDEDQLREIVMDVVQAKVRVFFDALAE